MKESCSKSKAYCKMETSLDLEACFHAVWGKISQWLCKRRAGLLLYVGQDYKSLVAIPNGTRIAGQGLTDKPSVFFAQEGTPMEPLLGLSNHV